MLKSNKELTWFRSFFLCFAVGAAAIALTNPVAAQHRRSCHVVVEVNPTGSGLERAIYSFRVFNTVSRRRHANDGRRAIRRHVTTCVTGHWNDRNATRPHACQDSGQIEMSQYPFNNMYERIRQDICDKNRDQLRLPVNIEMFIRGRRGCLERREERGVVDPAARVSIASNYRFNCPIRDGGGSERSPAPPDRPPLPNIRLPGNDLPGGIAAADNWRDCWDRCERNNACRAWTFRAAGTSGPVSANALCLQKSGVTVQVPDNCCQSGIKD